MTLFQAILLATSLGWTIVEATPPPPAAGLPNGPKYEKNITSIAPTETPAPPKGPIFLTPGVLSPIVLTAASQPNLPVPCETCITYSSPRVESSQTALDIPTKPSSADVAQTTTPPETKPSEPIETNEPTVYPPPPPKTENVPQTKPAAVTLPRIPIMEQTRTSSLHIPSPTDTTHPPIPTAERPQNDKNPPIISSIALIIGTKTLTGSALLSYLTAPAPLPAYTIGPSHAVTPGSPAIIISGTTYSAAATGTELYANGKVLSTSLPTSAGGGDFEQHLEAAIWSALGVRPSRSGEKFATRTTSAEDAGRTGMGSATATATATGSGEPALQTGGARGHRDSQATLLGGLGVGCVMGVMALL